MYTRLSFLMQVHTCTTYQTTDLMNVMIRRQGNCFSEFTFIVLHGVHKLVVLINDIFPRLSRGINLCLISISRFRKQITTSSWRSKWKSRSQKEDCTIRRLAIQISDNLFLHLFDITLHNVQVMCSQVPLTREYNTSDKQETVLWWACYCNPRANPE